MYASVRERGVHARVQAHTRPAQARATCDPLRGRPVNSITRLAAWLPAGLPAYFSASFLLLEARGRHCSAFVCVMRERGDVID